uniref:Uncharacterized protein n=1 Tax=Zea mays TaxID=4577 RepID=C4J3X8_MAIZE|nr:unknown [Zea mays]
MCMSILPRRISAGSSLSTWLVVKTTIRSPVHADQSPSMKLSRPDRVTESRGLSSASPPPLARRRGLPARSPVTSSVQSMSSMTMMDLLVVSMRSLRRSLLVCTTVSSTS